MTFKPADVADTPRPSDVRCLRTKNVQDELDLDDVWAIDSSFVRRPEQFLQTGDVIISTANSWNLVGKCSWVPELPWRATFGGFVTTLRPRPRVVDPRYLYRWMSWGHTQATLRSFGQRTTSISNMNLDRCRKMSIPLPPIDEQRRIAAILDKADELRAKRRTALAHLDSLTQSIFLDMFGDPALNPGGHPLVRLGDICAKFSDGPFGSNLKSSHYVPSGVRVIRLQNIGVDRFIDDNAAFVSDEHFNALRKHECLPGDVLVGTLGDPNLRACIQPGSVPVALNKANCVQIRAKDGVSNGRFLTALLNQPSTCRMAHGMIHGQTRSRLSMGQLRELIVPVPPVELQDAFASRMDAVESTRLTVVEATEALDVLFKSL